MEKRRKVKRPASLDGIQFDALLSQDEQYSAQVPDYPVESGYNVHDSVLPEALTIKTTLYLSNTPVTWKSRIGLSSTRVQDVEERLREIFWNREPVTYRTSDKRWSNMCITSLTISKTEEDGYARKIPIELKQVEITATKTVTVPESYARGGKSEASGGTASTRASAGTSGGASKTSTSEQKSESQKKASILYNAGKGLGLIK